jgi:transposase
MKLHGNARLSVKGRELLIERIEHAGWSLSAAAEAAGISDRTARKWLARYRFKGIEGLLDRSSAPVVVANRTGDRRVEVIAALRRLRMTGAEIAETLDMALSTVSGILTRIGMGKLGRVGLEPAQRYERERPGELIHIVEVLTDEKATTAIGFLRRAVAHYASYGITVQRLITDNGSAYRSTVHAIACRTLRIRHLRTRPYRPQTNGKAERFIRTMLAGWAYGAIYRDSHERNAALAGWLDFYNRQRPHGALSHRPPLTRLHELNGNNLLGSYT